jgi:hypothetical protein
MKLIVGVSDLQIPYHHPRAVRNLAQFIKDQEPDDVVCVGDEIDFPMISRWHKGQKLEYEGQVHKHRDIAMRVMDELRVKHVMRSNHGDRLQNYLTQYAPAFADDPDFKYERYMRYDQLGITYHEKMYEFAPGWLLAHGDEGGLSSEPGKTALGLARGTGKSVLCGHTHRAGIQPVTEAYSGRFGRTRWGVEAGCLMDLRHAKYLKTGGANWQMAFAVFWQDGNRVSPQLVYIDNDGSFVYDGFRWRS